MRRATKQNGTTSKYGKSHKQTITLKYLPPYTILVLNTKMFNIFCQLAFLEALSFHEGFSFQFQNLAKMGFVVVNYSLRHPHPA